MFYFVKPIEGSYPVPLCISGVVKHLIDKIIDPCIKTHGNLANMDHLCGSTTNDMDSENLQCFCMKQDFKHPRIVPHNLISCDLVVVSSPNLVTKTQSL